MEIAELAEVVQQKISELCANTIAGLERGERPKALDFVPLARLKILVGFYAPELRSHIEQIENVWKEVGNSIAVVLMAPTLDRPQQQQLNLKFLQALRDIKEACNHFTEAAAESAQRRLGYKP